MLKFLKKLLMFKINAREGWFNSRVGAYEKALAESKRKVIWEVEN